MLRNNTNTDHPGFLCALTFCVAFELRKTVSETHTHAYTQTRTTDTPAKRLWWTNCSRSLHQRPRRPTQTTRKRMRMSAAMRADHPMRASHRTMSCSSVRWSWNEWQGLKILDLIGGSCCYLLSRVCGCQLGAPRLPHTIVIWIKCFVSLIAMYFFYVHTQHIRTHQRRQSTGENGTRVPVSYIGIEVVSSCS